MTFLLWIIFCGLLVNLFFLTGRTSSILQNQFELNKKIDEIRKKLNLS